MSSIRKAGHCLRDLFLDPAERETVATFLLIVEVLLSILAAGLLWPLDLAGQSTCTPVEFSVAREGEEGVPSESLEGLSSIVAGFVNDGTAVGAELLVIQNRRILLHDAWGWRDRESRVPLLPGGIYNIRSMTKPLVATLAGTLIEEGMLNPSDEVSSILPGEEGSGFHGITVDHLLTHRSGLPSTVLTSLTSPSSLEEVVRAASSTRRGFDPGDGFRYSDTGADVLAGILSFLEGKTIGAVLEDRIFGPLGMKESFMAGTEGDPRRERVPTLYVYMGGTWIPAWKPQGRPLYPFGFGSQGVFSTAKDYARFLFVLSGEGACPSGRLLSAETVGWLMEPVTLREIEGTERMEPTNLSGTDPYYGRFMELNVPAGPDPGPGAFGHSGSDGTRAWVWPDLDLMVLLMTQSRGGIAHLRLEKALDRLLIRPDRFTVPPAKEPPEPTVLGLYRADFGEMKGGLLEVGWMDGTYTLAVPGRPPSYLLPPDDDGYRGVQILPHVSVSFGDGPESYGRELRWREDGETFSAPRTQPSTGG